jgi:CrcB protein
MHESSEPVEAEMPVDPDVPAGSVPRFHRRAWNTLVERWDILLAIAAGGAVGSVARWAIGEALPHQPGHLPWSTAVENVSGAFALGVLMVFVVDLWPSTRYMRPFVGVGLLGGYTTFSTYMLDTRALLAAGEAGRAAGYLFGTLIAGLAAAWIGIALGRTTILMLRRRRSWST